MYCSWHYSESCTNKQQGEIQCAYFRQANGNEITKIPITVVSEANDQSRIAAHTCV